MNHFILLLICILSVEIFIRLNILSHLDSIYSVTRKVTHIITQNSISDHWKEKIVPAYALSIMKSSLQILLILLFVLSVFLIAELLLNDFFKLVLSLIGALESLAFASGYIFIKKFFLNE